MAMKNKLLENDRRRKSSNLTNTPSNKTESVHMSSYQEEEPCEEIKMFEPVKNESLQGSRGTESRFSGKNIGTSKI